MRVYLCTCVVLRCVRLYLHLTRGATKPLTSTIICDAIANDDNIDPSDGQLLLDTVRALFNFSYDNEVETKTVVKEVVTQRQLISVVQQVFRNNKYAAISLSDLQVIGLASCIAHVCKSLECSSLTDQSVIVVDDFLGTSKVCSEHH